MRSQLIAYLILLLAVGYSVYEVRAAGRETDQTVSEICVAFKQQSDVFLRFVSAHAYTHGRLDETVQASALKEIGNIRSPAACNGH